MRLLAHITFYDRPTTFLANLSARTSAEVSDSAPYWLKHSVPHHRHLYKTSFAWRLHTYRALQSQLLEMHGAYEEFDGIDVFVDVNSENVFTQNLTVFGRSLRPSKLRLEVRVHKDVAPFRLACAHRSHMEAVLQSGNEYDWFLYTEDDTLVPGRAMTAQLRMAQRVFAATNKTLGFVRVVNDSTGLVFYADAHRYTPEPEAHMVHVPGLGRFATPLNPYAASWAYPRSIMHEFVRSTAWRAFEDKRWFTGAGGTPDARQDDDRINVAMGYWRKGHGAPYMLLPVPGSDLYVWHLSVSGEWYAKLGTTKKVAHGGNFVLCSASQPNVTCTGSLTEAYDCIGKDSKLTRSCHRWLRN